MLGGTVFTPQLIEGAIPWLEEAYAAHPDLATRFETAGIHAYAFYPPEGAPEHGERLDPPLEAKIQMHAWLLAQHGGDTKPIWITEIGWPVQGKVDEATQARFTVRATILAAHAGASAIFFYTLRDGPHPEAYPPEDAFGLLHNDDTPKPAYLALKTLLAKVGERWATTDDAKLQGMPSDARAVVFRGAAGKAVICAWTVDTPAATVTLAGGGIITDQFGTAKGSADTITLTPDVTFIEPP